MKKILSIVSSLAYLATPSIAFAATSVDTCDETSTFATLCNLTTGDFGGLVGTFITLLFVVATLIALGFLVFGGIKWILSGGDKTAVEGARNTIVAAIVGLVIVFLSYFILNIVLGFFDIDINNLEIPTFKAKP